MEMKRVVSAYQSMAGDGISEAPAASERLEVQALESGFWVIVHETSELPAARGFAQDHLARTGAKTRILRLPDRKVIWPNDRV